MTHVLFVNTRSAIGADVAVHLTLIENLDSGRCRITVATNSRAVDLEKMMARVRSVPGVEVVPLNLGYEIAGRGWAGKFLGVAGNAGAVAYGLCRLAWLVHSRQVDIIHTTDRPRDALVGTLLARLSGRKNLIHFHIKWYRGMGRAITWALRKADAVLAISDFVARSLIAGGVAPEKVHTALNATDPCQFDLDSHPRGTMRRRIGVPASTPLVGIVARIMVWKGHRELVEAMAVVRERVPEARLAIVGKEDLLAGNSEGSYTTAVQRRIDELGLTDSVHWVGWLDDMPSVYADIDVLCVPSVEEPFGLVVTEAMAMERPVVGFEAGALPEIIEHGREGLLVPSGDTCALGNALADLLLDPERRAEMGRIGRETVERRFTPRRQADEVAAIYERVCGFPSAAQPIRENVQAGHG